MELMKQSMFVRTFGNTPKVKVLDFLLDNDLLDWCKADIAEQTKISRATIDLFFEDLIRQGIITKSRTIGRATLYRLNKNDKLVQKLIELDDFLSKPVKIIKHSGNELR
jgi:predicted transcriptional regulator